MFTQLQLPGFIDTSVKNLSNCCTAMSMIVIGTILADVDFKALVDKTIIYFTILRLVLLPLAVLIGLHNVQGRRPGDRSLGDTDCYASGNNHRHTGFKV
jgi:predicted permease